MYHIQLRHFPHNTHRFNLTELQLQEIVGPWCEERWIEVGERKWNPNETRLTILEGPHIPVEELSMGRGWSAAKRDSQDVTGRVLAATRAATAGAPGPRDDASAPAASGDATPAQLLALLGVDPEALLEAWRHASALYRNRSPSERLALAEEALRSDPER
ncbi:MAG TPA: hypothetical protein VEJ23_01005 [Solirubrobacteraceae bacterium]|nr:hypothetical protein [Solirubrobacteraceae bacterium]